MSTDAGGNTDKEEDIRGIHVWSVLETNEAEAKIVD